MDFHDGPGLHLDIDNNGKITRVEVKEQQVAKKQEDEIIYEDINASDDGPVNTEK